MRPREVAVLMAQSGVRVAGNSACAEDHAAVLHRAFRIPKPCADQADLRLRDETHHLSQPGRVTRLDVVIQEKDEGAVCEFDAAIVQPAVIERPFQPVHLHAYVFA